MAIKYCRISNVMYSRGRCGLGIWFSMISNADINWLTGTPPKTTLI